MTAFARVITLGRNDTMPKVVRIPVGVGVDGTVIRAPITIQADEAICPECKGTGEDPFWDDWCERCRGQGIITIEQDTSAGRCLPAAGVGRPVFGSVAGRPLNTGVPPASGATAEPSRVQKTKARTVLRLRVPKSSSASYRPAEDMPPDALPGTLDRVMDVVTTLSGLVVFGGIGYFFLVLAA